MIAYLKGRLAEKSMTEIVIDCGGVAYDVHISLNTYEQLPDSEQIQVYTHLLIREDAHTLYGFFTKIEREVFRQLISVSGIGANTARTMLSSMTSQQIIDAISTSDIPSIQAVKGIGVKTAQRVVIDLKDKILKVGSVTEGASESLGVKNEAVSALEVLGYSRKQTDRAIDTLITQDKTITVEQVIKQILKTF